MNFVLQEEKVERKSHPIWCEKYRPTDLGDYIGNESIKDTCRIYLKKQDIPHLLLFGPPGTGKCLDGDEFIDIKMDVSEDEYKILKKYELNDN